MNIFNRLILLTAAASAGSGRPSSQRATQLSRLGARVAKRVKLTSSLFLMLGASTLAPSMAATAESPIVNPELSGDVKVEKLPGEAKRPNIVVILADDLGYADVSFNPHSPEEVHTPNIDRLAADGVICTNGYVSGPICAPTRAGLLTGRFQARFGFYDGGQSRNGMPLNEVTIAQVLGEAGYTSGVFGKWHVGFMPEHNPVERGFDYFYGFLGHGSHDFFDLKINPKELHNAIRRNHKAIDDEGYLTNRITEESIAFIEQNIDKPFFAYVAYNAPHTPMQAPQEHIDRYDTGDPTRDTYLAMVNVMDEGIGQIVDTLKKHDVYEDTLIFFLSDNGGARNNAGNNAPFRAFKQDLFEGGIHVPFTVTWPSELAAGTSTDVPVIVQDLFATAAEVAGISVPLDRPIDGKNLLPALRNEVEQLHGRMFWAQDRDPTEDWAITEWPWKRMKDRNDGEGLFNLEDDPGEKNNLIEEYPELAAQLESTYRAWRGQMPDPLPESGRNVRDEPLGDEYFSEEYLKRQSR